MKENNGPSLTPTIWEEQMFMGIRVAIVSHYSMPISVAQNTGAVQEYWEIQEAVPCAVWVLFVLLPQNCFGYTYPLHFHIKFKITLSISFKKYIRVLDLGRTNISIILSFPKYYHGMFLHLYRSWVISLCCILQFSMYMPFIYFFNFFLK